MSKHTPGPWKAVEYAGFYCLQTKDEYCNEDLLDEAANSKAKYNAQLAASAPELLDALQAMLSRFRNCDNGMIKAEHVKQLAEAAIKKATE